MNISYYRATGHLARRAGATGRAAGLPVGRTVLLTILALITCLLLLGGCSASPKPAGERTDSAVKLLSDSLNVLKNTKSYRFRAAGIISYLDIAEVGHFTLTGEYRTPDRSHMTMKLMLGQATYHSELLTKRQTMYQTFNDSWKIVSFDPNTLMQPGYHPVNLILDQISMLVVNPSFERDEKYNGKKVIVIKAESSPRKLSAYLHKQFTQTAKIEPDRRAGLMNFLTSSSISQHYTFYIDPDTKQIVKLVFLQDVKINLSDKLSKTQLSTTYFLADFGADINVPALPQ